MKGGGGGVPAGLSRFEDTEIQRYGDTKPVRRGGERRKDGPLDRYNYKRCTKICRYLEQTRNGQKISRDRDTEIPRYAPGTSGGGEGGEGGGTIIRVKAQNHFFPIDFNGFLRFKESMLRGKIDLGRSWRPLGGVFWRLGGV